jgi:hypothetical protein
MMMAGSESRRSVLLSEQISCYEEQTRLSASETAFVEGEKGRKTMFVVVEGVEDVVEVDSQNGAHRKVAPASTRR